MARGDLETKAKQAELLVATVLSDATNALFKADAQRNAKESRFAWVAELVVLGLAAVVALLPVTFHYLRWGPKYSTVEQIGLHLAFTAALATFAGVLLARARSRDHAAQRANDLSTATGTMISYSNQIFDPAEQQRFMTTMGQLVL
jgi:protein-S-isoprenylcysteine O-methyltransferase Ste14